MQFSLLGRILLTVVLLNITSDLRAQEEAAVQPIVTPELVEAHHALLSARMQAQRYQFVTLPHERRSLDEQIKFASAEIKVLKRRLRDYRPFLRVGEYSPVRTAAESHRLALLAAEQRLRVLKDERIALMRLSRQQHQLNNLEVLHAAARLAALRNATADEQP